MTCIKKAKYSKFGNCYEPSEQIPHGGMIFPSGHKIPNYNPDHGPTVSDEEAEPPIPDFLRPITEVISNTYHHYHNHY